VVLLAAVVAALVVGSGASASRQSSPWAAYLAPVSACPHAGDGHASAATQQRVMTCLINWMRRRIGVRSLGWSRRLAAVADTKARIVIQCGDFSHYPCGTRWPTSVATARRAWNVWGENLYTGNLWLCTPRAAMLAWLQSPEHRKILFGRSWTRLGVSVHLAPTLIGGNDMSLWVLEVAGRQ
jgi:uncharacterized protein YkwD